MVTRSARKPASASQCGVGCNSHSAKAAPFANDPALGRLVRGAAADPSVRTVVLSAAWGKPFRVPPKGQTTGAALRRTVELLTSAGKNVIVVGDNPTFETEPRRCKFSPEEEGCRPPLLHEDRRRDLGKQVRAVIAGNPRATFVDLAPLFRDERGFSMQRDGRVLYRDTNHLNADGSRHVAAAIVAAMRELEARNPS